MSAATFVDLFMPGDPGDTPVEVRLTLREVAAVEYVVTLATAADLLAEAQAHTNESGVGGEWNVAFRSGQARLGMAMARVVSPEQAVDFAALLAVTDQDQSALDNGEELL